MGKVENKHMEKIKKYQGLRGWAILFIMISHFGHGDKMLGPFGVSLFIGLSGFLTCYLSKDEKIYDIKWYIRKILKFYPLYLLVTFITAQYFNTILIYGADEKTNKLVFILNIFMLQTYVKNPIFYGAFTQVGWYIPFFFLSIILTPIVVKLWKKNDFNTAYTFLGITIFVNLLLLILSENMTGEWLRYIVYICPIYRMMDYIAGGYVATIFLQKKNREQISIINVCRIAVILLICFLIYIAKHYDNVLLLNGIWLFPVWCLLYLIAEERNMVWNFLFENPVIVFIGNISLELFLCHLCIAYYYACYLPFELDSTVFNLGRWICVFSVSFIVHVLNNSFYKFFLRILYRDKSNCINE